MIPYQRQPAVSRVFDLQAPSAPLVRLAIVPVLLLSLLVGILLIDQPTLAMLPLGALVSALLLVDGRARLVFVVFGGLLVLQRSSGLDMSKLALLGGYGVAFLGALLNVRKQGTRAQEVAAPLIAASAVFAGLGVLSLSVAYSKGTPLVDSVRDATPYLLFASTPIFALDAEATLSRRALVRILVVAGLVGTVSFAFVWLQRRGIADLPLARIGAASVFLPAALFAFSMSHVLQSNTKRLRWFLVAALVLALLVATGTRTTLALLVAPLAIVVATRRRRATRFLRLSSLAPVAAAMTLLSTFAIIGLTGADTSFLEKRLSVLRSTGESQSDASFNDRIEQGKVSWATFESSPVFGVGPGHLFEWRQQGISEPVTGFVLDTPLTYPAKFGIAGLLVLLFVVTRLWSFVRSVGRLAPGVPHLALVGYLAVCAALSIFAPPFEDKGFSYGLIILYALALAPLGDSLRSPTKGTSDPHQA